MVSHETGVEERNSGMNWDAFDEARIHDTYPFRSHDSLIITRIDSTTATFGEVNWRGYDGALGSPDVGEKEQQLAVGRSIVKEAIETVSQLDRLFVPGGETVVERQRPKGDWDPNYDEPEVTVAIAGLSRRARSKQIRHLRRDVSLLKVHKLNKHIKTDRDLAVKLESPEDHNPTAVRLIGFRKRFVLDPMTGKRSWRPVIKVQNRIEEIDAPPSDSVVTGLFVKRAVGKR